MNETIELPEKPVLADYQKYVEEMIKFRGLEKETLPEKFMLFLEECGELAKAARKQHGLHYGDHSKVLDMQHEAADVFIYLIEICNMAGIDLETAFREKEAINKSRVWKQ